MIRKAKITDVPTIHKLLQYYGNNGELLPRPLSKIYDHIRDFWVFAVDEKQDQVVTGCCALQICWEDLAEIRSLAVHPDYTGRKMGSNLVQTAISDAKSFGIKEIFTLTYRPGFFERFGFSKIHRSDLPLKIWSDCILCVKFPDCDEIAMLKTLSDQL